MAEVAAPRQIFVEIMSLIARCGRHPRQHEGPTGAMSQATKVEMCLDEAEAVHPAFRSRQMAGSDAVVHAGRPISLATDAQQIDPGLKITGIRRISEDRIMPTIDYLRTRFARGYDSGNVLSVVPNFRRLIEELRIGGSYRSVFMKAVFPYLHPSARVLELGPGRGSWSRAILRYLPQGELHTVDFIDVSRWLEPTKYGGRLVCHQVSDNSMEGVPEEYFDFFWSFGVLCHNNQSHIRDILENSLHKMKPGSYAVHQYGDWEKLDDFGWWRGTVPTRFKNLSDDDIWWPRNNKASMRKLAGEAGWEVVTEDLGIVKRDSLILLRCPT